MLSKAILEGSSGFKEEFSSAGVSLPRLGNEMEGALIGALLNWTDVEV